MPRPLTDSDGRPLPGSISEKIYLEINGAQQGMFLQGADVRNPVLLYLHGGMPEFFLTERTWLVHRTACSAFETAENMCQSGRCARMRTPTAGSGSMPAGGIARLSMRRAPSAHLCLPQHVVYP
jgi:hypothetical protein